MYITILKTKLTDPYSDLTSRPWKIIRPNQTFSIKWQINRTRERKIIVKYGMSFYKLFEHRVSCPVSPVQVTKIKMCNFYLYHIRHRMIYGLKICCLKITHFTFWLKSTVSTMGCILHLLCCPLTDSLFKFLTLEKVSSDHAKFSWTKKSVHCTLN